jgi:hypothetical protein
MVQLECVAGNPKREVLEVSMAWLDDLWDEQAGLLWTAERTMHMTRETALYALGLLSRAQPGDNVRAVRALDVVLDNQYDSPGSSYDGTFRRGPEEPDMPPADPVMWLHFDPNWRQFLGTTLAAIADRHGEDLPRALNGRIRSAIERAVTGEPAGRVASTYSNIALMKAWLDAWSGRREQADDFAREIHAHYVELGAFLEYNSPTYYGIDLSALALWRNSTDTLVELGAELEALLWRDIARFYHAGMLNMCGPYDRSYGMDMTKYATPLGLWIWAEMGRDKAPFPDPSTPFDHPNDMGFGPLIAALGPQIPDDVKPDLGSFSGERYVEQTITDEPLRTATAWLSDDVMIGAQSGPSSGIGWLQHHHATLHRRTSDGQIAWMRLLPDCPADARAKPNELSVWTSGSPLRFEISGGSIFQLVKAMETNATSTDEQEFGDRFVVTFEPARSGQTRVSFGV